MISFQFYKLTSFNWNMTSYQALIGDSIDVSILQTYILQLKLQEWTHFLWRTTCFNSTNLHPSTETGLNNAVAVVISSVSILQTYILQLKHKAGLLNSLGNKVSILQTYILQLKHKPSTQSLDWLVQFQFYKLTSFNWNVLFKKLENPLKRFQFYKLTSFNWNHKCVPFAPV